MYEKCLGVPTALGMCPSDNIWNLSLSSNIFRNVYFGLFIICIFMSPHCMKCVSYVRQWMKCVSLRNYSAQYEIFLFQQWLKCHCASLPDNVQWISSMKQISFNMFWFIVYISILIIYFLISKDICLQDISTQELIRSISASWRNDPITLTLDLCVTDCRCCCSNN